VFMCLVVLAADCAWLKTAPLPALEPPAPSSVNVLHAWPDTGQAHVLVHPASIAWCRTRLCALLVLGYVCLITKPAGLLDLSHRV
jgi:hypothetical protein